MGHSDLRACELVRIMEYQVYVDGRKINAYKSLPDAMKWIHDTFDHINYLRGVRVFMGQECVFNGKRFGV